MKCLNKFFKNNFVFISIFISISSLLSGCTNHYDVKEPLHISSTVNLPIVRPTGLADENAVIPYDAYVYDDDTFEFEAGLLINETTNSVVTAVNPHKRIYPASMTKVLTAIIVMEAIESGQISLEDTVVVHKKIEFNEDNVSALGLKPGDYITVNELLHGLLISSYNDCAIVLARYISGSVNKFTELMNKKAIELGATNSNFVNPHGLHSNNHYSTPYDLYLIFKEFLTKDLLIKIDSNSTYLLTFYRENEKMQINMTATNGFLSHSFDIPTGYSITGWKTGTTDKAGNCIILQFIKEDTQEKYICLVANAKDYTTLYQNIIDMLKEVY